MKALAVGEMNKKSGEKEVFMELNGQLRSLNIKDKEALKVGIHICQNDLFYICIFNR